MVETYYLFSPTSDLVFELAIAETEEDQNIALANLYITLVEIRDELLDIDDVPECAKTYHDLMLSATNTAADMYALEVFANTTGDDYYAGLSKQRLATLEEISESIELERLELGWTNEDGDLVNEPPTLEGD